MKITLLMLCCSILLVACGAPSPKPIHGALVPINRSIVVGKASAHVTGQSPSMPGKVPDAVGVQPVKPTSVQGHTRAQHAQVQQPKQPESKPAKATSNANTVLAGSARQDSVKTPAQPQPQPSTTTKKTTTVAVKPPPKPAAVKAPADGHDEKNKQPSKPKPPKPVVLSWHENETLREALTRWVKKSKMEKLVWYVVDADGDEIDIPISSDHTFKKGLKNALYQVKKAYATAPIHPITLNFIIKTGNKTLIVTNSGGVK